MEDSGSVLCVFSSTLVAQRQVWSQECWVLACVCVLLSQLRLQGFGKDFWGAVEGGQD